MPPKAKPNSNYDPKPQPNVAATGIYSLTMDELNAAIAVYEQYRNTVQRILDLVYSGKCSQVKDNKMPETLCEPVLQISRYLVQAYCPVIYRQVSSKNWDSQLMEPPKSDAPKTSGTYYAVDLSSVDHEQSNIPKCFYNLPVTVTSNFSATAKSREWSTRYNNKFKQGKIALSDHWCICGDGRIWIAWRYVMRTQATCNHFFNNFKHLMVTNALYTNNVSLVSLKYVIFKQNYLRKHCMSFD